VILELCVGTGSWQCNWKLDRDNSAWSNIARVSICRAICFNTLQQVAIASPARMSIFCTMCSLQFISLINISERYHMKIFITFLEYLTPLSVIHIIISSVMSYSYESQLASSRWHHLVLSTDNYLSNSYCGNRSLIAGICQFEITTEMILNHHMIVFQNLWMW
jgi:hypothetical protein